MSSLSRGEQVDLLRKKAGKLLVKGGQRTKEGVKQMCRTAMTLIVAFAKDPRIVGSWYNDIRDAIVHFTKWVLTGFRLFGADVRASYILTKRIVSGYPLSLRERQLLVRTTSDCLKLIPFSFFIIVPFAELALPFFLRMFPNMLPSTFFEQKYDNATLARKMKAKQEMAEFWQQVVHQRTTELVDPGHLLSADKEKELQQFQEKLLEGKEFPTLKEILRFSKLFEKDLSLASMSIKQLRALSRVLGLPSPAMSWWKGHLEVQLRHHVTQIRREDRDYLWEGIDSLSTNELIEVCRKRNIRFHEVTEDEMRRDLARWLELSSNRSITTLALLWIHSFYMRGVVNHIQQSDLTLDVKPPVAEEAEGPDKAFGSMAERQKEKVDAAREKLARLRFEIDEVIKPVDQEASTTKPREASTANEVTEPAKEAATELKSENLGEVFEDHAEERVLLEERSRQLVKNLKLYRTVVQLQKDLLDKQLKLLCSMRNNQPTTKKDANVILLDQKIRLVEMVRSFENTMKEIEAVQQTAELTEKDEEEASLAPSLAFQAAEEGSATSPVGPASWDDLSVPTTLVGTETVFPEAKLQRQQDAPAAAP